MEKLRDKLNNIMDNKKYKKNIVLVSLLIILFVGVASLYMYLNKPVEVSYNEFLYQVKSQAVDSVYLNDKGDGFKFTNKNKEEFSTINPKTENFREFLLLNDIEIVANKKSTYVLLMLDIGRIALLILFMVILIGKMGLASLKKQDALVSTEPLARFEDIAGHEEAKADMLSLVNFLKDPTKYYEMGAKLPKGVVLTGPPGTGKTLMARAMAGEADVPFFSISGSDFIEMFAGLGAKRVRDLFKSAREVSPCIIFIDEIDAIGTHRSNGVNDEEKNQTINALLSELDGFNTEYPVITIVATNRVEDLDRALIRPGRFDKHIAIELPDSRDRLAILNVYAKNKKLSKDINLEAISKLTIGFSGAALEALMNEAAILAVDNGCQEITFEHIDDAYFKLMIGGHKKKNAERDEDEIELIAYHEAGHALVSKLTSDSDIPKVTIIPSTTGMGGATSIIPKERGLISKKELLNAIRVLYAGRAAEYVLKQDNDEITSGAENDIKVATSYIKNYYGDLGMSEFGMIAISNEKVYMDSAMALSNQLYNETVEILENNIDTLKRIALELIDKETINGDELNVLIYK